MTSAFPNWFPAAWWQRLGSAQNLRAASAWVLGLVGFVSVALVGLEVADEQKQKAAEIGRIQTANVNLARSLVQHAEDTLEMADTALVGLVERLKVDGTSPAALARLDRLLAMRVGALPRIRGLFIYGPDGEWLATSQPMRPPGATNSDREYFKFHQTSPDLGPHLGLPVRSRTEGQWILTVTRRFNRSDGSFGGVVLATIDVSYFALFHATFDLGSHGSIALVHTGGTILSRMPSDDSYIGLDLSRTTLFTEQLAKFDEGAYRLTSPIDGLARIAGYRRGERFPMAAVVALGEDDALANWRQSARNGFLITLLLTAGIVTVGLLLARKLRHLQVMEAALTANEANFRLLAETAGDMVSRIGADQAFRYVSPASARLLGREPSEMVGRSSFEHLDEEGRDAFRKAVAQLRSSPAESVAITHRGLHADGSSPWLETTLRLAGSALPGTPRDLVAVTRDVTERKVFENELAALAATDALTGLANRRAFNATLESEWGRAKRDGTPLSLALFDLDRFKQFNDTYGHSAGDAALISVAAAMFGSVHRPGDLAARYGGEELALILPGTDLAGALVVADRFRNEISAMAIPHAGNQPAGVLTISGGVATFDPHSRLQGETNPLALINAADGALYSAKRIGRNAVVPVPFPEDGLGYGFIQDDAA